MVLGFPSAMGSLPGRPHKKSPGCESHGCYRRHHLNLKIGVSKAANLHMEHMLHHTQGWSAASQTLFGKAFFY